MVQAHLCGRLPRDTLVVCINPELPPSLLCMDVAYYFRWGARGGGDDAPSRANPKISAHGHGMLLRVG
jgi:hypothetical protein